MGKILIEENTLIEIANAIRSKTGGTEQIQVSDMANQIKNSSIEIWEGTLRGATGLGDLPDIFYLYTDNNGVYQSVSLPKNTSIPIKIIANTQILGADSSNRESYDSYDLFTDVIVYVPTQNNFII